MRIINVFLKICNKPIYIPEHSFTELKSLWIETNVLMMWIHTSYVSQNECARMVVR